MIIPDVPVEDAAASSNDRYERSLRNDGDRQEILADLTRPDRPGLERAMRPEPWCRSGTRRGAG